MTWILVALMIGHGRGDMLTQEFHDQKQCEIAALALKQMGNGSVNAICLRKGRSGFLD
jgi:hypothetical protein